VAKTSGRKGGKLEKDGRFFYPGVKYAARYSGFLKVTRCKLIKNIYQMHF
jgi:hypothetical protein